MPKKNDHPEPEADEVVPEEEDRTQTELETARREAADYLAGLQRLQAEFENYRKRMVREQTEVFETANRALVATLLPALDNLERALGIDISGPDDAHKFKEGVEMVYKQMMEVLAKEGLEAIDPLGEAFDPHYHEALMHVPSDEHEQDVVTEVFDKGYRFGGRVIRPARVKVSGPG